MSWKRDDDDASGCGALRRVGSEEVEEKEARGVKMRRRWSCRPEKKEEEEETNQ